MHGQWREHRKAAKPKAERGALGGLHACAVGACRRGVDCRVIGRDQGTADILTYIDNHHHTTGTAVYAVLKWGACVTHGVTSPES